MKTPDEIKKGLECCSSFDSDMCLQCPYDDGHIACCLDKNQDALAYINQLEQRLAQLEREKEALLADLRSTSEACVACKLYDVCEQYCPANDYNCPECKDKDRCICHQCLGDDMWEWRGVREVSSK